MVNLRDRIKNLPSTVNTGISIDASQIDGMKDNDMREILKQILLQLIDLDSRITALEAKIK